MRIFITGANGFIGRHIVAALLAAGHDVIAGVRKPQEIVTRFPDADVVPVDLNVDDDEQVWATRLDACDVLINCAGVLQNSRDGMLDAVHVTGAGAMFRAADCLGMRVVHISAISAEPDAGTDYARSKHAGDTIVKSLNTDWVILRPSLVYGARSYGGTSMIRALAAPPLAIPLVGKGEQRFQPIFIDDLTQCVLLAVETDRLNGRVIDPVGPEELTLKEILQIYRAWLGLEPVPIISMPHWLMTCVAKIGDVVGFGPLNSTSLKQAEFGNVAPLEPFINATGLEPQPMAKALQSQPAFAQDVWHARLYLLRPMIWLALGMTWVLSGLIGFWTAGPLSERVVSELGLPLSFAPALTVSTCLLDIGIGLAVLGRRLRHHIGIIQLAVITGYTLVLSYALPGLWLDPLGPLLKNFGIVALVLVSMATDQDR